MRPLVLGLVLPAACALALGGCHNYGFFPDMEGESSGTGTSTEGPGPTTLVPTTVSPTTVSPTTVSPTTVSPTTIDPTVTSETTDDPPGCNAIEMPPTAPLQGFGQLDFEDDSVTLSCGPGDTPDVVFEWSAPVTARFRFNTQGSGFDTLLGVFDGSCLDAEIACNDDFQGLSSEVEVDLFAGQRVSLVVDSFGPASSVAVINVAEVDPQNACPDIDFGTQVNFLTPGQTAGASDAREGTCGGVGAPEIEAVWTAPFDSAFTFAVVEADFDPVLYVRDGCDGPEIACSDNALGTLPGLTLVLSAGQTITLILDGAQGSSGDFTLQISEA